MITWAGRLSIFFVLIILLSSGCLNTKSEVRELDETVSPPETMPQAAPITAAQTSGPTVIPATPGISRREEGNVQASPSPTLTRVPTSSSPKFRWGDILEDPGGTRYTLLEGNPAISGFYTAYKIKKCPCVELVFLPVQDTDERFRKAGSQHPMTICNQSVLKVLKEPWDTCDSFDPVSIDGRGNTRRTLSVPSDGRFLITGSHSGENRFVVTMLDRNGDTVASVFNVVGKFHGSEVIHLDEGQYTIVVQASGPWNIDITLV